MTNTLLRTETVQYGEIELVVETATLLTESQKNTLVKALQRDAQDGDEYVYIYQDAVVQTRQVKGLPFSLPDPGAPVEEQREAFAAFLNLPVPLINQWLSAMNKVNLPPTSDPVKQPGGGKSKDPKPDENA